jgi:hypothetical protein
MTSMLKWLAFWVRKCSREHGDCGQLPDSLLDNLPGTKSNNDAAIPRARSRSNVVENILPRLPSRVIDVGPPDGSKVPYLLNDTLHETATGHYIALSHCWGKAQPLTTTLATYKQRLKAIPLETLPRTFRDAVIVCQKLRIRYL